jgi:hypothetical protein
MVSFVGRPAGESWQSSERKEAQQMKPYASLQLFNCFPLPNGRADITIHQDLSWTRAGIVVR